MKMRKIVAILAAVLMLFSILPFSAFAADAETIKYTISSYPAGAQYKAETHKLDDYLTVITNTRCHFTSELRIYAPNGGVNGEVILASTREMTAVVLNAGNKTSTLTVSTSPDNSTWTQHSTLSVVSSYKDLSISNLPAGTKYVKLVNGSGQVRVKYITVTYAASTDNADCDHDSLQCGDTCPSCGETKEHAYANNCVAECENGCGTANPNYADHVYGYTYDANCDVCGYEREVNLPAADSSLTIAQAIAIGNGFGHNAYTEGKYYITGEVVSIENETHGNTTIKDADGNQIYIYGTYDTAGKKYGEMAKKHEVGMTITVYSIIGNYNNTPQLKNGTITEMTGGCEHVYECVETTDATCEANGKKVIQCANCGASYEEVIPALGHNYVDGKCSACGAEKPTEPDGYYLVNDASSLKAGDKIIIVAVNNDCALSVTQNTNNRAAAAVTKTGNVIAAPLGEDVQVITLENGNKDGTFAFNVGEKGYLYAASSSSNHLKSKTTLDDNGSWAITIENGVATIKAQGTNSRNWLRFNATNNPQIFSCYGSGQTDVAIYVLSFGDSSDSDEPECEHNWTLVNSTAATCTTDGSEYYECTNGCGETKTDVIAATGHSYGEAEQTVAPTCTTAGEQKSTCTACGDVKTEVIYFLGHNYVDGTCSVCGTKEPTKATITFDDVNKRTDYNAESHQMWEENGITITNNKADSQTDIRDFANNGKPDNHIRVYKDSQVIIAFSGMTSLVIDATGMDADKLWDDTLTNAGLSFSVQDKVYTILLAEPTDSITLTAANQVRANSITAYGATACEHEYDNACDVDCNLCYEAREVQHSVQHVEAVAATCTANGNIEYWYCDVCGMAWLDADCTLNTNLRAVVLPMADHTYADCLDVDCDVCGAVREAVGHNLTYFEAVVATNCQETSHDEYWYCENCGCYFGDAEASWQHNPAWLFTPGDCVRPEGAADCAIVPCEVCGNDVYGYGEHDVLTCQGGICSKCNAEIEGVGCQNYDTPACEDGVCYYCGGFVAGFGHENGAWAPCLEGECAYGCGLTYPATEDHVDADADDYCDTCSNHLACIDEDGDGWCDICWSEMPVAEIVYGDANGDGEVTVRDVAVLQQFFAGWDTTLNEAAADANGDGEVTVRDAALMQQYMAGWDVTLGG